MKTKNKFLIYFGIAILSYFLVYLVLDDAPLYLLGGAILGSLYELSDKKMGVYLSVSIWTALLVVAAFFYFKVKNKPVKYLSILLVAVLLYVVDFILYDIMSFETPDRMIILLNVAAMVLIKALVLSLIIYFEKKPKRLVNT